MVHGASVVHHIPGRLRVRLPRARRDPQLLRDVQEFVQSLGGVQRVEINPATGSILVHYTPESHEEMRSMLQELAGEDTFGAPPGIGEAESLAGQILHEADFLAAHSELARQIVLSVQQVNRQIRQATDNFVDLNVLVPASLAIWAFFSIGAEVSTPLWVSLGIFSFNSFVSLHRPNVVHVAAQQTAVHPPAS